MSKSPAQCLAQKDRYYQLPDSENNTRKRSVDFGCNINLSSLTFNNSRLLVQRSSQKIVMERENTDMGGCVVLHKQSRI